jgi:hypothetical protein
MQTFFIKRKIHKISILNTLLLITLIILIYIIIKFNSNANKASKIEEEIKNARAKHLRLIESVVNRLLIDNITSINEMNLPIVYTSKELDNLDNDIIDFEGFNNQINYNKTIVPNIIHLIYLNQPFISYYQIVNIYSMFLNHKPDFIYMHCDNCDFHGKYWNEINKLERLRKTIRVHKIRFSYRIFKKSIVFIEHKCIIK